MKIKTNAVSNGNPDHEVLVSVEITMDNGETYRVSESRVSASQCDLRIETRDGKTLAVAPITSQAVHITRRV